MPEKLKEEVLTFESDSKHLKALREAIHIFIKQAGFSDKTEEIILVALGEAFTNAIRHAYGGEPGHKIQVSAEEYQDKVILKIRDYGKKINLEKVKSPVLPPVQPGGLGIYFMKTMMDEMKYNTAHSEGNELILVKYKERGTSHEISNQKK